VVQLAALLTEDNIGRFERVLEHAVAEARFDEVRGLLLKRVRYQMRRQQYPAEFGQQLASILQTVPAGVLRLRHAFPLLPPDVQLALEQQATVTDYADMKLLRAAIDGDICKSPYSPMSRCGNRGRGTDGHRALLETLLDELGGEQLSRDYLQRVDAARGSFVLQGVCCADPAEFDDLVNSLFLRLLRAIGLRPEQSNELVAGDALALVDRAFRDQGGLTAARAEGRDALRGGMRLVCDQMTEQFKGEYRHKHLERICAGEIASRSWAQRVALAEQLLNTMRRELPDDCTDLKPAQLVKMLPEILTACAEGRERLNRVFRRL
jgi:hypothetical protein